MLACADPSGPVRLGPVPLASTIPVPMGPPWVAVDDTLTTWVGWGTASQVLANDSGLVNVMAASAVSGISVSPYHRQWVRYQSSVVGSDTVAYTAVDTTGTVSRSAKLVVSVLPVPASTNLFITGIGLSGHRLTITVTNAGPAVAEQERL